MGDQRAEGTSRTVAQRQRIARITGSAVPLLVIAAAMMVWHGGNAGLNRWLAVVVLLLGVAAGVCFWWLSFHIAEPNQSRRD
jgi:hypothetical protein